MQYPSTKIFKKWSLTLSKRKMFTRILIEILNIRFIETSKWQIQQNVMKLTLHEIVKAIAQYWIKSIILMLNRVTPLGAHATIMSNKNIPLLTRGTLHQWWTWYHTGWWQERSLGICRHCYLDPGERFDHSRSREEKDSHWQKHTSPTDKNRCNYINKSTEYRHFLFKVAIVFCYMWTGLSDMLYLNYAQIQ